MKKGDVVIWMGKPTRMTVNRVEHPLIHCVWFDQQGELRRAVFHTDFLTILPSEEKPEKKE